MPVGGRGQGFGVQVPPAVHVPAQSARVVTEQVPSSAQHEPGCGFVVDDLSPPQPANTMVTVNPAIDRLRVTSRPAIGRAAPCPCPANHRPRMC